jgi:cation transport regulator ChaB
MNGYICFYQEERLEVHADTLYQAKLKAWEQFKEKHPRRKIKASDVTAHLAQKNGVPVIHTATM